VGKLKAQVWENDRLSRHKRELEERLLVLEQTAGILGEQAVDGKEDMKSTENWEILTDLNPVLKEHLAQLQDDNMSLLAEQNVKKNWPRSRASCRKT
jgi:hypothetical protein